MMQVSRRTRNRDPYLTVYSVFDAVFRMLFPVPAARKAMGFRGISEHLSDPSGWFLWFDAEAGAYSMDLVEAVVVDTADSCACLGTFALKYYPPAREYFWARHAPEEASVRLGPLFDSSGTPTHEGMAAIPAHLFLVGYLDVMFCSEKAYYEFRLRSAPFRQTDGRGDASSATQGQGGAWKKGWGLVDRLLLAFCHHHRLPPDTASVQSCEGFQSQEAYILSATFGGCDGMLENAFPLYETTRRLQERGPGKENSATPWINKAWWAAPDMDIPTRDVPFTD